MKFEKEFLKLTALIIKYAENGATKEEVKKDFDDCMEAVVF